MDRSADRDLTAGSAAGTEPRWTIRPVDAIDAYHACEDLQRRVWGFEGDLDVVPLTQLLAAHKAGGVVLGAFDPADTLLGFCYGFVGRRRDGTLLHYSHMLAVEARVRSAGLGAELKWAQRAAVLDQGIEWMAWTYDPLESLNAYFNFSKLGVIARTYWEDLYGRTGSALHRGTATDRLLAEWPLASPRVRRRAAAPGLGAPAMGAVDPIDIDAIPRLLEAVPGDGGLPVPGAVHAAADARELALEIPARIQEIKAADGEIARQWRRATRAAFLRMLGRGYHVAECVRSRGRTFYVLRKGDPVLG